jgi:hypothetical protein
MKKTTYRSAQQEYDRQEHPDYWDDQEEVTIEAVKISEFGCKHCLWNGCECKDSIRFVPDVTSDGEATCKAYAYYD